MIKDGFLLNCARIPENTHQALCETTNNVIEEKTEVDK